VKAAIAASTLFVSSHACLASPLLLGGIGFGSPANRGRVISINEITGAGALSPGAGVSGSNAGLTGLTFDASGALYGSTIGNPVFADPASGSPTLVQLDPMAGSLLSFVPITFDGDPLEIVDLAAQPGTGLLYGASFTSAVPGTSLYTIDRTTGEATLVGATGVIGVTLAFAPGGTLYMSSATFGASGQTGSFLHTVDPTTAIVTGTVPITPLPSGNLVHIGGLAVRPTDGLLFASGREATVSQRGDIYTLTTTGAATLLGSTGVGEVGDLAFAPIPEPANFVLLSSALAALGLFARHKKRLWRW
jgi:hypothetical protein